MKLQRVFALLSFCILLHLQGLCQGSPPWTITEVDGSPRVNSPTLIKVTNGTLSCTGKTCTITIGTGTGNVTTAVTLTANLPVIGAGGSAIAVGTRSGNTTQYVTTTGTLTAGNCVEIDASGNFIESAAPCGGAGATIDVGTSAVTNGTATRLFYETAGNVVGQISGATSDGTTLTLVAPVLGAATATSITASAAGLNYSGTNTTDNASVQVVLLQGDRATVAVNDEAYATLRLSNDGGTQTEVARITWAVPDPSAGAEYGRLDFSVMGNGALAKELQLSSDDLAPSANDGLALGTTSLMWSDLFLASGAVVNFNAGNVVLTHSAGILTMGTGELRITTVGTNTASVPTIGSTSTFTNKTITASSNVLGGVTMTLGSDADGDIYYRASNVLTRLAKGTAGQCLLMNGGATAPEWGSCGAGGGITIGTTTITSGTATRLLYETAGNVVGEISGATSDGTTVTLTSPTINTGITLNAAPLTMSGNISAAAWTTNGIRIKGVAATLTDTTSSGTVAAAYTNNLGGNTIAASSSTTFTDYYSTFITAASAGANVTLTRSWALGLNGALQENRDALGTTSTDGVVLQNNTAAAAGAQQYSPRIRLTGQGWKTNATAASQTVDWVIENQPVQGAANPTSILALNYQVNGGGYNEQAAFYSSGQLRLGAGVRLKNVSGDLDVRNSADSGYSGVTTGFHNVTSFFQIIPSGAALVRLWNSVKALELSSDWGVSWSNTTQVSTLDTGIIRSAANTVRINQGGPTNTSAGNLIVGTSAGAIGTSGAGVLAFTLSTAPTTSPADTVQLYSADSAAGAHNLFSRNELGEINRLTGLAARNSAQFDATSTTTFATVTGLSRNVEASRTYAFTAVLQTTAAATGGVKLQISGTATATAISYEGILMDGAVVVAQTRATALDTAVCALTTSTAGTCTIRGVIQVNAGGTLAVQFAQNNSDGTPSSVLANQYFQLIPIS